MLICNTSTTWIYWEPEVTKHILSSPFYLLVSLALAGIVTYFFIKILDKK